jgi:hypothetical protein
MNARILLATILTAVAAQAAAASDVRITFSTPLAKATNDVAVAITASNDAGVTRTATLPMLAGGTIALDDGLWQLTATAPRYWTPPATLKVSGAAALALPLFRTVMVRGTVTAKVNELTIGFAPPPKRDASLIPASTITCPLTDGKFACALPAGLLDLTLRAHEYVAIYRWSETLDADVNLGTLRFVKGSSFTGSVAFAERQTKTPPPQIRVTVSRDSPAPQNEAQKQRGALTRQTAIADARGFFQLALAPGDYVVEATADGGLTSDRRDVRVFEGRETQLRTPLLLERPHVFTLHVTPPTAPYDKPWVAQLTRRDAAGVTESELHEDVPVTGEWKHDGMFTGEYTLTLSRNGADAWYTAPITVAGADVTHDATIATTTLSGTVTLAGKPISTNIFFSDDKTMRIGVHSHENGKFGPLVMPAIEADTWPHVEVVNEEPYVRRKFTDMKLSPDGDGARTIDIDVSGGTVFGDVADEKGAIQASALIDVVLPGGQITQIETKTGTFVLNAVAPGTVSLRASTKAGDTPGPTRVDVKGEEQTEVHLVVKPGSVVNGIVSTRNGPIAGAGVAAISLEYGASTIGQTPSDPDGRFTLHMPSGTSVAIVSINAPGYAYRLTRMPIQSDPPVPVLMSPGGGALVIDAPTDSATRAFVIHDGGLLPLHIVSWLAGASIEPDGRRLLPQMEPGRYDLCWLDESERVAASNGFRPPDRCASALVTQGASVTLKAPELPKSAKVNGDAPRAER